MSTNRQHTSSLKSDLIRSWAILGIGTIGASCLAAGALIFTEYYNRNERVRDDLKLKAPMVARRVSAELLLGAKGTLAPVIVNLKQELKLDEITVTQPGIDCTVSGNTEKCLRAPKSKTYVLEKIPYLQDQRFVVLSSPRFPLRSAINLQLLILGTIPLLLLVGAGIVLQWSFLKRKLLRPLGALLESGGSAKVDDYWSTELLHLSEKLDSLLDERDRAKEEAHRLKTETLVYDLSQRILHDLKSPLGTLGLMIETDLKDIPVETKDAIRRVLSRIRGIVDFNLKEYSADAIANQIRNDESKNEPESHSSSIGGALKTILEEEEFKANHRGVEVVCDLSRVAYQCFVPLSFSDLCRVLSNIIANAVDASEQNGKRVFISTQIASQTCEIVVKDYGKGFQPEVLAHLDAGERYTTKKNGTGLGLSTVRGILNKCGGTLNIQSLPTGSLVRITIPKLETPKWYFDVTRIQSKQVLALDDDATIKEKLDYIFPGSSVLVTQTENDFLKQLSLNKDSLLIVDYDYGGTRNGLDLILSHDLVNQAVLVSGRISYDSKIRTYAEKHGVKLFPKECLG